VSAASVPLPRPPALPGLPRCRSAAAAPPAATRSRRGPGDSPRSPGGGPTGPSCPTPPTGRASGGPSSASKSRAPTLQPSCVRVEPTSGLREAMTFRQSDSDNLREEAFHVEDGPLWAAGPVATIPLESTPLACLGDANRTLIAGLQRGARARTAPLDAYPTLLESHKDATTAAYDGTRRYQPVVVLWADAEIRDRARQPRPLARRPARRWSSRRRGSPPLAMHVARRLVPAVMAPARTGILAEWSSTPGPRSLSGTRTRRAASSRPGRTPRPPRSRRPRGS